MSILIIRCKMATICCRERAVLVAVYAERPGRRRLQPSTKTGQNRHHHHHHYHHHLHHRVPNNSGRGYNRRAELLDYARNLRASAQPVASPSIPLQPNSHNKLPPRVQIVAANRMPKHARSPTCFCKWGFLIPSFLRAFTSNKDNKGKKKDRNSSSTTTKIKALVKSLQVQKKGSFVSRLFTKLRTHR